MGGRAAAVTAAMAMATAAGGCVVGAAGPAIRGSGTIARESREVGPFTKFEAQGAIRAVLTRGAAGDLVLSGDDNLLPWIETEVRDGTLTVRVKDRANLRPTGQIAMEVTVPTLESVVAHGACAVTAEVAPTARVVAEAHGASQVTLTGVEAESLAVASQGASRVTARGRAGSVATEVAGASNADLSGLAAGDADLDISGASGATVRAAGEARGEVSGASTLTLLGRPAADRIRISGASSVKRPETAEAPPTP